MTPTQMKSSQIDHSILVQFILIYFFIHIVIYSSHNYRETIAKEVFSISSKDYSFIEMISVIKLGGSIISTYISQKYVRPLVATVISLIIFMGSLTLLISKVVEDKRIVLLIGSIHIIADSAILPTIDAECLTILNDRGIGHKFSKIRVFSTLGHSITYLINILIQKLFDDTKISRSVLINTLSFGVITIFCLIYSVINTPYKKVKQKTKKSAFNGITENISFIFGVFNINYTIMLIAALGSGISRSSLQSYLSEYLMETRGSKGEQGYIYFVRTICELFVWSIVIWLGDRVSLETLFPLGIGLGAIRSLLYSYSPSNPTVRLFLPYVAELFKSAYSALFIYVATKLAYKYSKSTQKTITQGVFTGVYSGLSPFLAGILSYSVFSNSKCTDVQNKEHLFRISGTIGIGAALLSLVLYRRRSVVQI